MPCTNGMAALPVPLLVGSFCLRVEGFEEPQAAFGVLGAGLPDHPSGHSGKRLLISGCPQRIV